jgi:hypothetical protein
MRTQSVEELSKSQLTSAQLFYWSSKASVTKGVIYLIGLAVTQSTSAQHTGQWPDTRRVHLSYL